MNDLYDIFMRFEKVEIAKSRAANGEDEEESEQALQLAAKRGNRVGNALEVRHNDG